MLPPAVEVARLTLYSQGLAGPSGDGFVAARGASARHLLTRQILERHAMNTSGDCLDSLKPVLASFDIDGRPVEVVPWGTGHINDTYRSTFETPSGAARYIHQRINHGVFTEPEKLMDNVRRVTAHLRHKVLDEGGDPAREALSLVPARDGSCYHRTDDGEYWRTYLFIEGARTYDVVEDPEHVYAASKAFGMFQTRLADLPGERLHETIARFHDTGRRFTDFAAALEADACNRAKDVREEIDFVLQREEDTRRLIEMLATGRIPERVTHNDTKLNNVMIDDATGEGICVIDLDTVMPGATAYDFGDSVRVGASTAAEDERDVSKVAMDLALFEQLARGYLDATRGVLTPLEVSVMPLGAKLMTFECGMRFLADHLSGDVYYKIHRPGHNLDRARTQFKMVRDMEEKTERMDAIVAKWAAG